MRLWQVILIFFTVSFSIFAKAQWTYLGGKKQTKYLLSVDKDATEKNADYYTVAYHVPLNKVFIGATRIDIDNSKEYLAYSLSLGLGLKQDLGKGFEISSCFFGGVTSASTNAIVDFVEMKEKNDSSSEESVWASSEGGPSGFSYGPEINLTYRINKWLGISLIKQYTISKIFEKISVTRWEKGSSSFDRQTKSMKKSLTVTRQPVYFSISSSYL